MKISGGLTEKGVVVGNCYDKYGSRNPIARRLIKGFESALTELVDKVKPSNIHEVGCGEGYWTLRWLEQGIAVRGSDFSEKVIELARMNALERNLSPEVFKIRSIYDLDSASDAAELVVCCEVLEHLERPQDGLQRLQLVANPYLIVSVPCEPIWSIMNIVRGKYLRNLGNTPGHIQRWSRSKFIQLVSRYFDIEEVRKPVPWTMLLCRCRSRLA
ncbi:class I SAM-dependent methyltransferase [Desulfallas thermosapovorans]|uniref:Methyltransferase family protein n=1 Tax=Desulfallas thermosapovorans DSM 6562 TaxID=1121431 RepID=A0A5S4ZWK5_9FIRM|nr:class I SAM-dependent methyltransferase [Desulfallas thermosapovorans]TYO96596.1 methyltransferase family protein [Desulfallas thermosapovorans DSM 6562]